MIRGLLAAILLLAPAVGGGPASEVRYLGEGGAPAALRAFASARPDAASVVEVGESLGGRTISGILLGLPGDVPVAERPRLLVVGGLEADVRVGTAVAAALPARLLALAAGDEAVAAALRRTAVEVIPLANPDGLAALLAGPEREFRTNVRPVDADRDREADEDGPDDLDGDGRITTMRVPDPAGPWRVSDEDPRLLVRADAAQGEIGRFRLVVEGRDADGDGEVAEDPEGGVDLDRNFPHGWKEHDPHAGTSPMSEPESRALAEHFLAAPSVAAVLVYGRHDDLASPPKPNQARGRVPPDGPLPEDHFLFAAASRRFSETMKAGGPARDPADGAFHQWVYYQQGVPAFSSPLFYRPDPEDPLPSGKAPATEDGRWLAWLDGRGGGYADWTPIEHPNLGPVEIGGFAPLARVNPPEKILHELADRQVRFVADLLDMLPELSMPEAAAKPLGPGVFEVTATIRSERVFPVITAMAERARAGLPVRVTIDVPAERILQGRPRELVDRLGGAGDVRSFRWVVRGDPGSTVEVRAVSEKAGAATATVTLPGGDR